MSPSSRPEALAQQALRGGQQVTAVACQRRRCWSSVRSVTSDRRPARGWRPLWVDPADSVVDPESFGRARTLPTGSTPSAPRCWTPTVPPRTTYPVHSRSCGLRARYAGPIGASGSSLGSLRSGSVSGSRPGTSATGDRAPRLGGFTSGTGVTINRNTVKHHPKPKRQPSGGVLQRLVGQVGLEPTTDGL